MVYVKSNYVPCGGQEAYQRSDLDLFYLIFLVNMETKLNEARNVISYHSICGEWWYVTYYCPSGWPRSLLKGSELDTFLGIK